MALFSRKSKNPSFANATEGKEEKVGAARAALRSFQGAGDLAHVLKRPRITEKATMATTIGIYVFDVDQRATKNEIRKAVEKYYKVVPRMVRVVTIPEKRVRSTRTGARGVKQGGKKAYVYLKRGESITIA